MTYPNRDAANGAYAQICEWNGTMEQTGDMSDDMGNTIRLLGGGSRGDEAFVETFSAGYHAYFSKTGITNWVGLHINTIEFSRVLFNAKRFLGGIGLGQVGDAIALCHGALMTENTYHWGMHAYVDKAGRYFGIFGNDDHRIEIREYDPNSAMLFDMSDYGHGMAVA